MMFLPVLSFFTMDSYLFIHFKQINTKNQLLDFTMKLLFFMEFTIGLLDFFEHNQTMVEKTRA